MFTTSKMLNSGRLSLLLGCVALVSSYLSAAPRGEMGKYVKYKPNDVYFPILPPGFVDVNVVPASDVNAPTGFAIAPDGRLFIIDKAGHVWIEQNGVTLSTPFLDLSLEVQNYSDEGMLSIALDPNFSTNPVVYLAYVVDPDSDGTDSASFTYSRVVSYRASASNPNVADLTTRNVLLGHNWGDSNPICYYAHTIDYLCFAPDGSLFISWGGGEHYNITDAGGNDPGAFGPGKASPDLDIGAFRAQYLGALGGKVLRVDPATGNGLPTNPFYDGTATDNQSRVWSYGLRNPWRFTFKPGTGSTNPADGNPGEIYIGQVGLNDYECVMAAPRAGMNFGWPCMEGPEARTEYQAATPTHSGCANIGTLSDPSPITPPLIYYHHDSASFAGPVPGYFGNCILGSTFYNGNNYPAKYKGAYFYTDFRDWMRVAYLQGDSVVGEEAFGTGFGEPVDVKVDPSSGDIYYASYFGRSIHRITYDPTGIPPVARASAGPSMGSAPLNVSFVGSCSSDPSALKLTYHWTFGDSTSSNSANPTHTYTSPGVYFAQLRVTNANGASDSMMTCITVGTYTTGFDVTPWERLLRSAQELLETLPIHPSRSSTTTSFRRKRQIRNPAMKFARSKLMTEPLLPSIGSGTNSPTSLSSAVWCTSKE